jgi:AcrR family transcriptional regulator
MDNDTHRDESKGSTYERLVSAGMAMLVEKGYLGATTRDIARVAGVTEVTLYRHFRSKDDLLSAGIARQTKCMFDVIIDPTGDLEQDLLMLAKGIATSISADIDHIVSIIPELGRYPVLLTENVQRNIQKFRDDLATFFRHYQETGDLTEDADDEIVMVFAGPMFANMLFGKTINAPVVFDFESYVTHFLAGYRKKS